MVVHDLNLRAKSHLYLVQKDGEWLTYMRYDEVRKITSFDDLLGAAFHGMHGKSYIDPSWADLLIANGYNLEGY